MSLKSITLRSSIFFCLLVWSLVVLPSLATGIEVTTTVAITGEGVIDSETGAESEVALSGIKYEEGFYTKSLGYYELSTVNFTRDFAMISSDKLNTTLTVEGLLEATNVKQKACLRHYGLKARQSFWTHNDTEVVYMFESSNCSASFDLAQNMSGAGGYKLLVLNSSDYHVKEYIDTARYLGDYELLITNFIGCNKYPEAEDGADWLQCPNGPTFDDCEMEEP